MKARLGRAVLPLLWALLCACASPAAPAAPVRDIATFDRAEAVQAGWDSAAPPGDGWVPVKLIDDWSQRWPQHDGVVWYRLRFTDDGTAARGLLIDYACLAQAVYLNGSLLHADVSQVEPLSRSWVKPDYFVVDKPLLRAGTNELLVRVSGFAAYQPGFGTVSVGAPGAVQSAYQRGLFQRFYVRLISFAISAVLGTVFALMWLLRRKETVFGWYALSELFGSLHGYNYVATSPWPLAGTHVWESLNMALFVLETTCAALFLFRFMDRRFPRLEKAMWVWTLAAAGVAVLLPHWNGTHRNLWLGPTVLLGYATNLWFVLRALRSRRADAVVMAICTSVPLLVSLHDLALYLGWVHGDAFLLGLTSVFGLIGVAFALAWRFVGALRQVENFNVELRQEVAGATARLTDTLAHKHQLELDNARINERLNLVRDVHDGFGGTLLGTISELEHGAVSMDVRQMAQKLRGLRDDLRLILDSTQAGEADFAQSLAPLRHRWTQRLELDGIRARWDLDAADGLHLGASAQLDVLRLLQEALTNVLKHSSARKVEVRFARDQSGWSLHVHDDGVGLPGEGVGVAGTGMASLRARARRLGGTLEWSGEGGGTGLDLRVAAPKSTDIPPQ